MRQAVLPLTALLAGIGILVTGNGLLGTLVALRASSAGFSAPMVGVVMAAYFVGLVVGSTHCVGLIQRAGHIRTFAGLAAVASAASLAHLLFVTPVAWVPLRLLTGFCIAGLYMVTESWLNERAPSRVRGRVLSVYMVVNLGGLGLGQLLLPLRDPAGYELFCLASILFSLALVPVALTRTEAPAPMPAKRMAIRHLHALSPLGTVTCFAGGLAAGALWGIGPLFARTSGMTNEGVALFMAATIFGGLVLQWPLGHLSDRFDRRKVIACLAIGGVGTGVLLTRVGVDSAYFLLLTTIFGGMIFPLYSIGLAHSNDFIVRHDFLAVSSGLLLVYGIGAALGPLLAGAAMSRLGATVLFSYEAVVLAVLAVVAIYRTQARPAVSPGGKAPLVVVPRTTPAVSELDPRSDPDRSDIGAPHAPSEQGPLAIDSLPVAMESVSRDR